MRCNIVSKEKIISRFDQYNHNNYKCLQLLWCLMDYFYGFPLLLSFFLAISMFRIPPFSSSFHFLSFVNLCYYQNLLHCSSYINQSFLTCFYSLRPLCSHNSNCQAILKCRVQLSGHIYTPTILGWVQMV